MDGKRFGIGLAAGLLLGLAIVTASGGLGSAAVIWGPSLSSSQAGQFTATTTTNAATTIVTLTSSQSSSTSSQSAKSVYPTNSTDGSVNNIPSTISTTTSQGQSDLTAGSSAKPPSYSSRIVSISQQPLLSNTVIFVPVLLAFLLGAVLYRASNRSKSKSDETQS
jgi:hypothetical protein